jgi:hypothetical protein
MLFRKFFLIALVAMAIGGFSTLTASNANAQATSMKSANISALINNPIELLWVQDLDFGEAAPSTAATTVSISAAGVVGGDAIGKAGAPQEARFSVSGLAGQAYTIDLPTVPETLTSGGGDTMTVSGFVSDADGVATALAKEFGVGATLNIGADQAAGSYSGSFDVTVSYN